jgi:tetratricopeptide (TPR) repeat protein
VIDRGWEALTERAARRPRLDAEASLLARYWMNLAATNNAGLRLRDDLEAAVKSTGGSAELHNALGLATKLAGAGRGHAGAAALAEHFRRALALQPRHPMARMNLAEALMAAGQSMAAFDEARAGLEMLAVGCDDRSWLECGHLNQGYGPFRVEWERAAWANVGDPAAEARAKVDLIRWRLHMLLAQWTGDLAHAYEAVLARPDLPGSRTLLGRTLARGSRPREAAAHLRRALDADPFDRGAARSLYDALGAAGLSQERESLAHERMLMSQAAPKAVPQEPWFAAAATSPRPDSASAAKSVTVAVAAPEPAIPNAVARIDTSARARVSLSMIVKNEESNLPDCLNCIAGLVDEIVIVDTGSTDRTRDLAVSMGAKVFDFPWVDDFAAARNASLERCSGDWVIWLDADDRFTKENRKGLLTLFAGLGDENTTYSLKVRSSLGGGASSATLMDQARLFRNHPHIRWKYRVHEQILPAARRLGCDVRFTDVIINHVGYQNPTIRRGKLERNVRLLELDHAEHPDDSFVLFNLGWTYIDLGRHTEALGHLRRSLELVNPSASIVRKLYALITQVHRHFDQPEASLAACREGLSRFHDDAELLSLEGTLLRAAGDLTGAEASWLRVLESKPGAYFGKLPVGLRGYKARNALAEITRATGRPRDAEAHWLAALAEQPDFVPAVRGLSELYLAERRWPELESVLSRFERKSRSQDLSAIIRARGLLAREEFADARRVLMAVIARSPTNFTARVLLTHTYLREDRDPEAARQALLDVLGVQPEHAEAKHNLAILERKYFGKNKVSNR